MIRVVLAEDNALLRDGLSRLIDQVDDLELVGTAADLPSLRDLVARSDPDVVVTDIRMPPSHSDEGVQVVAELRRERPGTGAVILSQHGDPAYAITVLDGGSAGRAYLLKDRVADPGELLRAIREVASGGSVIDPVVVEGLVAASRRKPSDLDRLSPREVEVLGALAEGKSNAAIAQAFHLSERAVEKHCSSIFMKLGLSEERNVNRRVMAVLQYLDRG